MRSSWRSGGNWSRNGLYLRPRFSPGYGDFDIHYQEPIMRMLDCAKTDRTDNDGQLYDDADKVGDSSDRSQSGEGRDVLSQDARPATKRTVNTADKRKDQI